MQVAHPAFRPICHCPPLTKDSGLTSITPSSQPAAGWAPPWPQQPGCLLLTRRTSCLARRPNLSPRPQPLCHSTLPTAPLPHTPTFALTGLSMCSDCTLLAHQQHVLARRAVVVRGPRLADAKGRHRLQRAPAVQVQEVHVGVAVQHTRHVQPACGGCRSRWCKDLEGGGQGGRQAGQRPQGSGRRRRPCLLASPACAHAALLPAPQSSSALPAAFPSSPAPTHRLWPSMAACSTAVVSTSRSLAQCT